MRRRYAAAAIAVLAVTTAAGLAIADPRSPDSEPTSDPGPEVTLLTGDRVRTLPDGALQFIPGEGRRAVGYTVPPSDGLTVIPSDATARIASGEWDARLFDVEALRRNGYHDASDVGSADELSGDPVVPSAAAQPVTGTVTWMDGSAPMGGDVTWINLDTGDADTVALDTKGGFTTELEPGDYSLLSTAAEWDETTQLYGDMLAASTAVTVADRPVELAVDGTTAHPVGFAVDREAEPVSQQGVAITTLPNGDAVGATMAPGGRMYLVESTPADGSSLDFIAKAELRNTESGYDDPFGYSLVERVSGFPADPTFTVHDTDLARLTADYQTLAAPDDVPISRQNSGHYPDELVRINTNAGPVETLPNSRTEYYTADPGVSWDHYGSYDDGEFADTVYHRGGTREAGDAGTENWDVTPVSVGMPIEGSGYGVFRGPDGGFTATMPMFTGGTDSETIFSSGLSGKATLSRDDTELITSDTGESLAGTLPDDDRGHYTLTMGGSREPMFTTLGASSTATWQFDSAPVDTVTPLPVPVVRFNASGVANGYADRNAAQDVRLDYLTQPGAAAPECTGLTLQVSYDESESWTDVPLDRDGGTATATLDHPAGVSYVSIKLTGTDAGGNSVTQTTIDSYRLR